MYWQGCSQRSSASRLVFWRSCLYHLLCQRLPASGLPHHLLTGHFRVDLGGGHAAHASIGHLPGPSHHLSLLRHLRLSLLELVRLLLLLLLHGLYVHAEHGLDHLLQHDLFHLGLRVLNADVFHAALLGVHTGVIEHNGGVGLLRPIRRHVRRKLHFHAQRRQVDLIRLEDVHLTGILLARLNG